jgi:hypothetical protein
LVNPTKAQFDFQPTHFGFNWKCSTRARSCLQPRSMRILNPVRNHFDVADAIRQSHFHTPGWKSSEVVQ